MKKLLQRAASCKRALSTFIITLAALTSVAAWADVTGTVTDETGEPLIGANVAVKGTNFATNTDIDGNFTINAEKGQTLVATYIGYLPTEVTVKGSKVDIVLKENAEVLSDVVVVGYGTMEKRRVTSSITSINPDDLNPGMGGATIATALQGKVSGLTISGTSSPNSSNGFQLRGVASVNAGQGPLVVIDGVPGGDIRTINQEDVQSIDVLKDASAGAIYGTRAAGGVILITTKRAQEGKVKTSYTCELSIESVRKHLDLLSSKEYVEYGVGQDYGYDTDWYKEMTRDNPLSQRHVLTVSGGSQNLQVYSSLMYQDQKGIVIGDGRKDYSARINGRYTMFDGKAEFGMKLQVRQADRDRRNNSSYLFEEAMKANPTLPLWDPSNPSFYNVNAMGFGGTSYNPVASIAYQDYSGKDKWILGDATLKINLMEGLSIQGTVGVDQRTYQLYRYYNQYHKNSVNSSKKGSADHQYSKTQNISYEAYASYMKDFNTDHHFDAVAGWSFYEQNYEKFEMSNSNFTVDGIGGWDMSAGTDLTDGLASMESSKSPRERLLSFFGRANYSYKNRYMATASYRREGSSKFGSNNRWGNFWSLSAGWRISSEDFMEELDWISDLKIRAGYGVTGNNDFGSGYTTRTYTSYSFWPVNGTWLPTYGSAKNTNPDLKWEEKKEFNIGLDFAFLNNRIWGKFDWYHRQVDDMLFEIPAPTPPMLYNTIMANAGTLTNTGWKFELSADIIQGKEFNWTSTARFSHNSSKIKNLGDTDSYLYGDALPSSMGYTSKLVNGSKIGEFWLYKYAGLDADGKWLIYDKDNNVVPATDANKTDANKHYVGNGVPQLIISWDNNFHYRDFDLGITLRSWLDFDVYNEINMYKGLKSSSQENVLKIAYTDNAAINDTRMTTDYFLSDASFLKIDAITLGYTLNTGRWNKYLNKVRFYATARDVATFTKYKGYNPEVSINGLFPGFEYYRSTYSTYPQTIRWTFGVQLNF